MIPTCTYKNISTNWGNICTCTCVHNVHVHVFNAVSLLVLAMKSIIDKQSNVRKIYVGDPHQQIYSFKGAVNALNMITPDHTFHLTQVQSIMIDCAPTCITIL